jgi:hypothetical protein
MNHLTHPGFSTRLRNSTDREYGDKSWFFTCINLGIIPSMLVIDGARSSRSGDYG